MTMGTHEGDETGADYFTVHAGIALDDTRDPIHGFDADALGRLSAAAENFAAELRTLIARGDETDNVSPRAPFDLVTDLTTETYDLLAAGRFGDALPVMASTLVALHASIAATRRAAVAS